MPTSTVAAVVLEIYNSSIVGGSSSYQDDDSPGSRLRQWSSLIGIVTAIVGNILISFALNIQRYAHTRIERELESSRLPLRKGKRKLDEQRIYGTSQAEIAEERAILNRNASFDGQARAPTSKKSPGNATDSNEADPLLQSVHSDHTLAEPDRDDEDRQSYLRSPYWWAGIILMTVGEAGNFLAYGFAPASIVSPLGVVALVSNCLIAPLMLKERFRLRDFWGVLVAIGGAVTIVLSAKQTEEKMGPQDLWDAISRWEFLAYLGITVGLIVVLIWASGNYGDRTPLIDLGLVGLFGGYTALSTKGVASLLSDTLYRALTFPIFYLMVAVLVLSALLQIRYINKALQRFDSTQVIPTQFVMFTISVIVGSAVLYRDFESATADRVGKFIGGCALTFFGVYLITSGRADQGDDDYYSDEDDEEAGIGLIDEEATEDGVLDRVETRSTAGSRRLQLNTSVEGRKNKPRPLSSHDGQDDFLQTPPRRDSGSSSDIPSIAVTPSPLPTPGGLSTVPEHLRWLGSEECLVDTPLTYRTNSPLQTNHEPPRLRSTHSSTIVPRNSTSLTATDQPPALLRYPSAPTPTTPTDAPSAPSPAKAEPLPPSTPTRPEATPTQLKRGSLSGRLLNGPMMSPLNSGLTAIVADSFRGTPTDKRRKSFLRRAKSQRNPDAARRQSVDVGKAAQDPPLQGGMEDEQVEDGDGTTKKSKGRLRSMSDTYGAWTGDAKRRRKERAAEESANNESSR